jgi:hypothetical protein
MVVLTSAALVAAVAFTLKFMASEKLIKLGQIGGGMKVIHVAAKRGQKVNVVRF